MENVLSQLEAAQAELQPQFMALPGGDRRCSSPRRNQPTLRS